MLILAGPQLVHWVSTPVACAFHGQLTMYAPHAVCVRPVYMCVVAPERAEASDEMVSRPKKFGVRGAHFFWRWGLRVASPKEVRVGQHVAAVVAHGLDELHEPDGGIHRDAAPAQRLHVHAPPRGLKQAPQPLDTHARTPPNPGGGVLSHHYGRHGQLALSAS